jgi:integrase/recombinase XerD
MHRATRSRRAAPGPRFPPEVLSDDEVRALLAACGGEDDAVALRHRALLTLLYRSGLRLGEALDLRPKDLDLAAGTVRVLRGKGGRGRVAAIDPGAGAVVARWARRRSSWPAGAQAPLFCSRTGRRLTDAYVRRLLPRLARHAGIAKRVHAHGLRHTHAAQLRAEGVDILVISRQLGHRDLLTTVRYLDHLSPTAVLRAIRARAWSA